jgi:ABC-type lipoprotein release transport system permease subunit
MALSEPREAGVRLSSYGDEIMAVRLDRRHAGSGVSRGLFFRLAWRNLWRNTKRTLIACASIVFAVFLSVLVSSTQSGQNEYVINVAVGYSTGHIQIHGRNYWEKRSLDQSMEADSGLMAKVRILPHVRQVVPRFETVSLISYGNVSKVSPVIGVDPVLEDAMTGLGKRIVRGVSIAQWHDGALIAEGLANMLGVDVGDSVVVFGQGYQGVTAAEIVQISGVVHFPLPEYDNAMFYLPLHSAQTLYAAPSRLTAVAIMLDSDDAVDDVNAELRSMVPSGLEVMTWRDMMPELVQAVAANNGGTVIMLLILYVVIGFGIFGTVVMMTSDRKREFGMNIALGMKRWRLMYVAVIESLMVSMIGAIVGITISIPVVAYLYRFPIHLGGDYAKAMLAYGMEPIIPFSMDFIVFGAQALIVFGLGVVSALYPVLVIRRLMPVQAMRG